MSELEQTNHLLIEELRKLAHFHQAQEKPETCEGRIVKHLKSVLDRLSSQFQAQSLQLEDYRKKERIFNLHKRCAEDSQKRIQRLSGELNKSKVQQKLLLQAEIEQQQKAIDDQSKSAQVLVEQLHEENLLLRDLVLQQDKENSNPSQQSFVSSNLSQRLVELVEKSKIAGKPLLEKKASKLVKDVVQLENQQVRAQLATKAISAIAHRIYEQLEVSFAHHYSVLIEKRTSQLRHAAGRLKRNEQTDSSTAQYGMIQQL